MSRLGAGDRGCAGQGTWSSTLEHGGEGMSVTEKVGEYESKGSRSSYLVAYRWMSV